MSIDVGDVVIEKNDTEQLKWTVCSIYVNPQNMAKETIIKRYLLNNDLTMKKADLSDFKESRLMFGLNDKKT